MSFGGARQAHKKPSHRLVPAPPPIVHRHSPQHHSPPDSPKRKPFAPSSVKVDMSGPPPPLPPVAKFESSLEREHGEEGSPAPSTPGTTKDVAQSLDAAFSAGLQHRSPRWMQVTAALWNIFVIDANRSVDKAALRNFLDAIEWRISGQVTEHEFLSLYSEWMAANYPQLKRRHSIGLTQARQLLAEKSFGESELDLVLGVMLYENSRSLLNRPLSFSAGSSRSALEVCSRRWLSLAEELFFFLDAPGYGSLQFDQMFFFSTCLVYGLRSWSEDSEVESDLSIGVLSAITANIIKDACYFHTGGPNTVNSLSISSDGEAPGPGGHEPLLARTNSLSTRRGADIDAPAAAGHRASTAGVVDGTSSPSHPSGSDSNGFGFNAGSNNTAASLSVGITMPIFKNYLIKMGIGESVLHTLTEHVKHTLAVVSKVISRWNDSEDVPPDGVMQKGRSAAGAVLQSCVPVELAIKGYRTASSGVVSPPLLWQSTILRVSGRVSSRGQTSSWNNMHELTQGSITNRSGIMSTPGRGDDDSLEYDEDPNYIGSVDGAAADIDHLSGLDDPFPSILLFLMTDADRQVSMAVRAFGNIISAFDAQNASMDIPGMQLLHSTVWKLVRAYKKWGQTGTSSTMLPSSNVEYKASGVPSAETRKDPIYQFILAVLTEYKENLLCLCSAFVDAVLHSEGALGASDATNSVSGSGVVALACAALLPRGEVILKEHQSYEKLFMTGSATGKPAATVRRNSMIKSRGSKWDVFSNDIKTSTEDNAATEAPSLVQEPITSPAPPFPARKAASHRRASAPTLSAEASLSLAKAISSKDDTVIPSGPLVEVNASNNKPFSSMSALFSEVSVDGSPGNTLVSNGEPEQLDEDKNTAEIVESSTRAREVSHKSYEDVFSNIEETSPNWNPAAVDLIASANWKSTGEPDSVPEADSNIARSSENSIRSNFSADAENLQKKLLDLILTANPHMEKEEVEKLSGVLSQTQNTGARKSNRAELNKKSIALSRLEEELKAEQDYAVSKGDSDPSERHTSVMGALSSPARKVNSLNKEKPSPVSSVGEKSTGHSSDGEQVTDLSTASSVIELLQQGHSAGQYAQTLRDLLRRMSKKNSNLQLKTLEDIIELGESIIAQEGGNPDNLNRLGSFGGRHGFGPIATKATGLKALKKSQPGVGSTDAPRTPPSNARYFVNSDNTREYMDSEATSTLLGEEGSPDRHVKSPKSRIISFMDEVVTDVGGRRSMASRTAAVPGRAPGGSPQKNRSGGSGMSRGLKPKPPPAKAFGHHVS